jgi:hypothetical protein
MRVTSPFFPNSSIQVKVTSTAFVGGKLSMYESGGPSTLFLHENGVTHWKMYCLPLSGFMLVVSGFMLVVHQLLANSPIQVKGRSIVFLLRKPLMSKARGTVMLFISVT